MKSFARHNVKRAGAAAAIAVAALSATGCGYIHQQPTTIHYAASDGVQADVADAQLRNIMVITEDKDSAGRLLGSVINTSDHEINVTIETGEATATVKVPANGKTQLEKKQVLLKPAGKAPGDTLQDTKISEGSSSTTSDIPVLDGTLGEYKDYLPNAAQSESSSSSSASPSESSNR